jgi:elongation factor G
MPDTPYRETISRTAEADYSHMRQTGGSGEYARIKLRLQPLDRGTGFEYANEVIGNAIPKRFFESVERGVFEAAKVGILNGGPVVDCRVTFFDGAYHDVDSSDHAFFIAAQEAFGRAMRSAGPKLLLA